MGSTAVLLATLFSLLAVSLLLQALLLHWGVRWAKGPRITFRKAFSVALLMSFASLTIASIALMIEARMAGHSVAITVVELIMQIIVPCAIVAYCFRLTFWRAAQAWLPTLVSGIAFAAFLLLVHRPFVSEAFLVPTNSMAPTILGKHVVAACPRCGAPAYGSAPMESQIGNAPIDHPNELVMICSQEFRTCKATPSSVSGNSDRILVDKLLAPRRWDIIAFRLPSDPSVTYIKRLVGLPSEELQIRDGSVWINGEKMEPPDELQGIEFLSSIEYHGQTFVATGSSPVKLAGDEYFVLGDFSAQATDSRFWEIGAPGHARYAVPKSHIVGVVTHIYWPISRWRAFR
jgi:signal peptidase I